MTTTAKNKEKIRFSKAFWVANTVELFERAAYYGVFIVITLYLSRILGFNDIQAATIAGTFSAFLYLLPTFAVSFGRQDRLPELYAPGFHLIDYRLRSSGFIYLYLARKCPDW